MPTITAAVFAMLVSVPPPDYQTPVIEGPQLFCGHAFSFRLLEGETVSSPWQGTARQAGHIAYYRAETRAGRINIYESPADNKFDRVEGNIYVAGGRFNFVHHGEFDDGSNVHSQVGFRTSDHEAVARILFDFIAPKRDEGLEKEVLVRIGRPPIDTGLCGGVG